jgi:hypothetical protein
MVVSTEPRLAEADCLGGAPLKTPVLDAGRKW